MSAAQKPDAATRWLAAAGEVDITPNEPVFLYGYPHAERTSTGVHDPLYASALCVSDGRNTAVFIACDIIWVPADVVCRARRRIADRCDIAAESIMVTATHTHSGPVTNRMLSNAADPVVPEPDPAYLQRLEDAIVDAAIRTVSSLAPASLKFASIDGSFLGTNRRDPAGPAIPGVPILAAFNDAGDPLAVMAICSMHPTVLHEDWTLISGDFPGLARQRIKQSLGEGVPFVYHMGASGDQSPRHVVENNTIDEAARLGHRLAHAITDALSDAEPIGPVRVRCLSDAVDLPRRQLPPIEQAEAYRDAAKQRLATLRSRNAGRAAIRTAEVDVFGAEETLTLARAAEDGQLEHAAAACLPAEVQIIEIGEHRFVGWPGEVFVSFAIEAVNHDDRASIITLANGDLQGYLVTQAAIDQAAYEAGNAIFQSPASGERLGATTRRLLQQLDTSTDKATSP